VLNHPVKLFNNWILDAHVVCICKRVAYMQIIPQCH